MSESEQNQDKNTKSHWRSLAELLGARPSEEPEVVEEPESKADEIIALPPVEPQAIETEPETPSAQTEPAKSSPAPAEAPPSDWFALAAELGVEVEPPPAPAPEEVAPEEVAPQPKRVERVESDAAEPAQSDRDAPQEDEGENRSAFGLGVNSEDTVDLGFIEDSVAALDQDDDVDEVAGEQDEAEKSEEAEEPVVERTVRRRRRRGRRRSSAADREREETPAGEASDSEASDSEASDSEASDSEKESAASQVDAPAEAEEEAGKADSDEQVETTRKRRSRRRRRRPRGGDESSDAGQKDQPKADDAKTDSAKTDSAEADSTEAEAIDLESDDLDIEGATDGDRGGKSAGGARTKHRKIPTWDEAVSVIVTGNIESRSKNGGSKGKSRGSRRRRS